MSEDLLEVSLKIMIRRYYVKNVELECILDNVAQPQKIAIVIQCDGNDAEKLFGIKGEIGAEFKFTPCNKDFILNALNTMLDHYYTSKK